MRVEGANIGPQPRIKSKATGGRVTLNVPKVNVPRVRVPPPVIVPNVRLDPTQVRDRRGESGVFKFAVNLFRTSLSGYAGNRAPTPPNFRAQQRIMKPYRNLRYGSLKMRGGR